MKNTSSRRLKRPHGYCIIIDITEDKTSTPDNYISAVCVYPQKESICIVSEHFSLINKGLVIFRPICLKKGNECLISIGLFRKFGITTKKDQLIGDRFTLRLDPDTNHILEIRLHKVVPLEPNSFFERFKDEIKKYLKRPS